MWGGKGDDEQRQRQEQGQRHGNDKNNGNDTTRQRRLFVVSAAPALLPSAIWCGGVVEIYLEHVNLFPSQSGSLVAWWGLG